MPENMIHGMKGYHRREKILENHKYDKRLISRNISKKSLHNSNENSTQLTNEQ